LQHSRRGAGRLGCANAIQAGDEEAGQQAEDDKEINNARAGAKRVPFVQFGLSFSFVWRILF
ncbi:MAG TPA: hypothetical protein VI728_06620, partial [Syntrophales bacterium]|nr:hypothetical protein [Syntrophales bacterium]